MRNGVSRQNYKILVLHGVTDVKANSRQLLGATEKNQIIVKWGNFKMPPEYDAFNKHTRALSPKWA